MIIIILINLGYIFIGGIISGFISTSKSIAKYLNDPEISGIIAGMFWPALFVIIPLFLLAYIGYKISTNIVNRWNT